MTGPETPTTRITHLVLDMAGTTVSDGGIVDEAFAGALNALGLPAAGPERDAAERIIAETMGQSKIEVFTAIVGPARAAAANEAFESSYGDAVRRGAVTALPGVEQTLADFHSAGIAICLTTGFSAATRDLVIADLGWGRHIDLALCPADAGRGRPWPDMIWTAMLRLRAASAAAVLVAGDTPSDVRSGIASGAGIVVGVLSGAGSESELRGAGARHVVAGVPALPAFLAGRR